MKILKNISAAGVASLAVVMAMSSCQKGFDAKTYAPTKPLPKIEGFSSSKDIEPGSLVAYWPFNSSLADSMSTTTGVSTGTSFTAGVSGKGLQGADKGYVLSDVPANVKTLHAFTVSIWVKMAQNTSAVGLFDIDNNQKGAPGFWGSMAIFFDNGGSATTGVLKVHAFSKAGDPTGKDAWEGGYAVADPWNKWINIIVTYSDNTSTVNVYYNGASAGTNHVDGFAPLDWSKTQKMVFGTLQFQTTPSLTVSTGAQDWAGFVTGALDQIRIYNKALTTSEIRGLYGLEKVGR